MKQIWTAFYWSDYLTDTTDLSLVEHGAYLMLMAYYYTHGSVPANAEQLHRICRAFAEAEQGAVQGVLQRYFHREGDCYRHHRADRELAKSAELSEKRRDAANSRYSKGKQLQSNSSANAPANAMQLDTHSHSQSQSHIKPKPTGDAIALQMQNPETILKIAQSYPRLRHLQVAERIPRAVADAIIQAIIDHGHENVLAGTIGYAEKVTDVSKAFDPWKFFNGGEYMNYLPATTMKPTPPELQFGYAEMMRRKAYKQ